MTPHPLFQFRTIPLHPTPDRGVVRLQTALGQQLFDVAERERVPKIPADCAENDFWRRLPPLEDRRPSYILHGLFRLPATASNVATQPSERMEDTESSSFHHQRVQFHAKEANHRQERQRHR